MFFWEYIEEYIIPRVWNLIGTENFISKVWNYVKYYTESKNLLKLYETWEYKR